MTDSSKSKKPTSKTQGVGFQKSDNEADSTASESIQGEKAPEMTDAKKTEPKTSKPEVPTESISVSPVPVEEATKAKTKPEVTPPPKPPEVKPEPAKAEIKPEVAQTPKPPEVKPEPISSSASMKPPEVKPEPINVVKPPAEVKAEPTTASTVPVIVEEEPAMVETSQFDVQAVKDKVLNVISDLPENFRHFFSEYQRPLWTVGGIILIIVSVKALVGVLDSINDVPLVKSTLEIVGMGYSVWFVYRYLLRSETRQELLTKFQALKNEVLGEEDSL